MRRDVRFGVYPVSFYMVNAFRQLREQKRPKQKTTR